MGWYLNRALTNFRNEVNARWPKRDKTSDGTIGDEDHQSRDSDHNPDPDGSVDAWDMDVDGVDVRACINAALRHESIQYIIYNRKITSRNKPGGLGKWHPYTGSNPHTKHVHFNTRPSHENSNKPWFAGGEMQLTDKVRLRTDGEVKYSSDTTTVEGILTSISYYVLVCRNKINELIEMVSQLKHAPVTVDASTVADALASNSVFVSALAKAVADEIARRMDN